MLTPHEEILSQGSKLERGHLPGAPPSNSKRTPFPEPSTPEFVSTCQGAILFGDDVRYVCARDLRLERCPAEGLEGALVPRADTQPTASYSDLRGAAPPRDGGAHRWVGERLPPGEPGRRGSGRVESSEAMIYAGMSHLMLRRLARPAARSSPAG